MLTTVSFILTKKILKIILREGFILKNNHSPVTKQSEVRLCTIKEGILYIDGHLQNIWLT